MDSIYHLILETKMIECIHIGIVVTLYLTGGLMVVPELNIRHLQPSHRKMTTFLVWCLNQPSKFLDKKHTYYCPIDVFIEYILVDVLLKLRDKVGHAEEGASVEGCGSYEEFLDED